MSLSGYGGYAYGVTQAAALARALGEPAVSVLELGVAGGQGLLELERLALAAQGTAVAVTGFDLGTGLPEPADYRDLPYVWRGGFFAMDERRLRASLRFAELRLGDIAVTAGEFLAEGGPPVGFAAFDLDYCSSTLAAMRALLGGPAGRFLPRVLCYFDDTVGPHEEMHCEFTGALAAIGEFNAGSAARKVGRLSGLRYKPGVPDAAWTEGMYVAHLFDHPRYCDYVHPGDDRQLPL